MDHFVVYRADGSSWLGQGTPGTFAALVLDSDSRAFQLSADSFAAGGITVAELREQLWIEVKARREAAVAGGADTPAGRVDTYGDARTNIAGAALAAFMAKVEGTPFGQTWKMADNSFVTLDAPAMIAMGKAVLAHVDQCHAHARVLWQALQAAEDVPTLLAIEISAGWPA